MVPVGTVALILRLRRSAQREAQRRLDAMHAELERSRQRERRAQAELRQADQGVQRLLERVQRSSLLSAGRLCQLERLIRAARAEVQRCAVAHEESVAQAQGLGRRVEQLRKLLHQAIERRESAERYEANERRERARWRERRMGVQHEESVRR